MQMPSGGGMKGPKVPMTKNTSKMKGKKGSSIPKKPSMK